MRQERMLAHIRGKNIQNITVLPAGKAGDDVIAWYKNNGDTVAEITGMDPMPGLGLGWRYEDGQFIAPGEEDA